MRRVAVTGHRGFLGGKLAERLEHSGIEVLRVDGDVREVELPTADGFLHFAAKMGGVGFFSREQFSPILDNAQMDIRVIRHCRERGIRLLFPSSACAYPLRSMEAGVALHEKLLQDPAEPDQMYGLEKYFITRLAEHSDFDMRVPILHTVYGEGQEFDSERVKFPPQICYKFCRSEPVEVWGDGRQTRTFLHVDDAVGMILEVFFNNSYFGPVNISHPEEVSVQRVVDILKAVSGRKDVIFNLDRPTGPRRRPVDNSKFESCYLSRPKITAEEGFVRLYHHIQKQLPRRDGKVDGIS